jgi:TolB-like protein/DNA-binding winged helix-turn-helix (wHTH) protein
VICFDSFELDVPARELRRGRERVRLQTQPFELLAMMLEQPGTVVTRAALATRLWPDGTLVDFDHSLNAAVKRLRAALGDDAGQPRFVETVPRRGYRFIAPCTRRGGGPIAGARTRVAVLPFTSGGPAWPPHTFSEGLTDELTAQLGERESGVVEVIARSSSSAFKTGGSLAREVGATLRADYLLEGSARHAGDRVRVAAWLVNTDTETPVWTGVYDRCVADVLAVQAEVASRIAGSVTSAIAERPRRGTTSFVPRARAYPAPARAALPSGSGVLNGV